MIYLMRNPLAAALLLVLIMVGGSTGFGWWLAARDRDAARVELVAEQVKSAEYAASIREQNRAVATLELQKAEAEKRGQAAQQLAAANGKRFDRALAETRGATASTCDEAMPVVDKILESIQ